VISPVIRLKKETKNPSGLQERGWLDSFSNQFPVTEHFRYTERVTAKTLTETVSAGRVYVKAQDIDRG
jgi:hypothetical protein